MDSKLNYPLLNHMCILRFRHGLKDEEYSCYKNYATKRMFKLRKQLNLKNSTSHGSNKSKYQQITMPEAINDVRYLTIVLLQAERSWIYAMLLKTDYASKSYTKHTDKHRYLKRFKKSNVFARTLVSLCQNFGNEDTQTHSMIYQTYINSIVEFEKGNYVISKKGFWIFKTHLEQIRRSGVDDEMNNALKLQIDNLQKLLRTCGFHTHGEIKQLSTAEIFSQNMEQSCENDFKFHISDDGAIKVSFKQKILPINSQGILSQLNEVIQASTTNTILPDSILSTVSNDSFGFEILDYIKSTTTDTLLKHYQEVVDQLSDSIDSIRRESLMCDIGLQDSYNKLEVWPNEVMKFIQIEKNLLLILKSLNELINRITKSKIPTCGEGIRFASIIKQELTVFLIGDYTKWKDNFLIPNEIIRNVNALCLSLDYANNDKFPECISLLEWVNGRDHFLINVQKVSHSLAIWRLLVLFNILQNISKSLTNRIYLRMLSIYSIKQMEANDIGIINFVNNTISEDSKNKNGINYDVFDIGKTLMPINPILIDAARSKLEVPQFALISNANKGIRGILSSFW
ncbi:signal recognition particle subunit SRP68 [Babesia microti strain RI]|uniref:Signal recognition particle subunit SRP68 n=1 Tax=Babesia microti (strain RI) TaxID=1133968 RepID=I7JCX3_BABMR|nr:signal recognition particle subunit SRP68 [Babesia microti strain RI]CCF75495.2 signal recognition particle subunit SRP68 [Babesia microti strain RI]|eukprot:XP_021337185.1 signal recognition particle subunit SRP68 [Babesia microti strain RI]